jgi:glycosyltransferase involved in cell wall biosynthesis
LRRTFESLARQSAHAAEIVIVDASDDGQTERVCRLPPYGMTSCVLYQRAISLGAATQRNQGVEAVSQPVIWFVDDDVVFEPECVARLYAALGSDCRIGGVSAMVTNQLYLPPSRVSRLLYALLNGGNCSTYAGRCFGPALNLLPEDRDDLPDVVSVEWLNTTCTMYRREALPTPAFDAHFTAYTRIGQADLEDLVLSLIVGKRWKLANARTARIFHDSQPGSHKSSSTVLAERELINRHYVMTRILGRNQFTDYLKLGLFQAFYIAASARSPAGLRDLPAVLRGKLRGVRRIISNSAVRK